MASRSASSCLTSGVAASSASAFAFWALTHSSAFGSSTPSSHWYGSDTAASSLACTGPVARPTASASAADMGMDFIVNLAMTASICKVAARYHTHPEPPQCRKSSGAWRARSAGIKNPQRVCWGFWGKDPGDDLLSHAAAHYHRRVSVSLPSSEWDRVVPLSYCHQGEGGGSPAPVRIKP